MNLNKLQEIIKNEPSYRMKQIKKAVFRDLAEEWGEATVLSLALRQKLDKECPLLIEAKTFSSENSEKILLELEDKLKVESVLMRHKDNRNTVCVSSQAGCPLKCSFCATGKMGFKRNLDYWEIVEQVLFFSRYLKKEKKKITNVVFMGMGEPFLNYDNVIKAIEVLNDKEGFNLGARRFSISTVGIVEGIEKLREEKLEINLAVSLHAPNDELRSKIMPINRKYPLRKVLSAVDGYVEKTRRRVMIEYVMIKDVNDSEECAKELAKLVRRPLYFVNLISYNPTGDFEASSAARIKRFKEILEKSGINVTQRHRFGRGARAGCGQLVAE